MNIGVTGHRPKHLNNEYNMDGVISKCIEAKFIQIFDEYKPDKIIVGLALGVDLLAVRAAKYLKIPVRGYIPHDDHGKSWPEETQRLYKEITTGVEVLNPIGGPYYAWKNLERNKYIVGDSDLITAVWNYNKATGTGHCINYAKKLGIPVEIIDLREIRKQLF